MKMTNAQKWQRVTLLRGLRKTLGEREVEELLRLELELSISQAKGRFTVPEKKRWFVFDALVNGQRLYVGKCETTEAEIKQAMPYATIEGNGVLILASPPLE